MIAAARKVYPLRKIVGVEIASQDLFGRKKVRLECGHVVWCSTGAVYNARCRKCHSENSK